MHIIYEPMADVRFHYDLGSPYAYLAAERVDELFGSSQTVEWVPVLLGAIFKATGRSSWAETPEREEGIAEVERRAASRGLAPFTWPAQWPNNGLAAMRVATWAHERGAGRDFAFAAFQEQFNNGRPLSDAAAIERAVERAGLDVAAAANAVADQRIKDRLRVATDAAIALGVTGVPTITVGENVFWGDDQLEAAAAAARSI